MKKVIFTKEAPEAIGPYSQAIEYNGLVFLSGQIPIHPILKKVKEAGIAGQTKQVLDNIKAILEARDLDFSSLIKVSIFLTDLNDFKVVNEIYSSYFTEVGRSGSSNSAVSFPARETIEVRNLPLGVKVEISALAHI